MQESIRRKKNLIKYVSKVEIMTKNDMYNIKVETDKCKILR